MTDLTPAQMVGRLRTGDGFGNYTHDGLDAATLIEQQAEQIVTLTGERDGNAFRVALQKARADQWRKVVSDYRKGWNEAKSEAAALRKALREAPHQRECDAIDIGPDMPYPCNCWKSAALDS